MTNLPSGTITFLFTDIEGSTVRWEKHPDEMRLALARHDELLRTISSTYGGIIFKTVGDAFYIAFASAAAAVQTALSAQRAFSNESWHEYIAPLRVRMAIHTGEAEQRDGDYFGQSLNRVARILSSGHGGQVLLSLTTTGLVRDHLSEEVWLEDLGTHRLKDIQNYEHIFQLAATSENFPPLKTLDNHPNNLPTQLTSFVGRQEDLNAVTRLLLQNGVRLVTLVGPGGVGKTRLGLQVASELADHFPSGVYFIDLALVQDKDGVVTALAQAIGVRGSNHQSLLESVKLHLQGKALLLIDNFEQVLDAAPLIHDMLVKLQHIKMLITSRSSLRLGGEYEYHVIPLATPDYKRVTDPVVLTQYESVALFVQQAKAARPDFQLHTGNAKAVAEICTRLDGLPLAIELAAARVKLLPPQALVKRLGHRLQLLTDGKRDHAMRQQTLRGAIAWSYNLLDPNEKLLFCNLSIFRGGCTLDAVETVCVLTEQQAEHLLDVLRSLVDKSLLRLRELDDGEPRFEMLYTIGEYASEQLTEADRQTLQLKHAHYYLSMIEQIDPHHVPVGDEQKQWLACVEAEYENIQTALGWCSDHEYIEWGLRLAQALWPFWWLRGLLREGRRWFDKLLASPGFSEVAQEIQAKAFEKASELACNQHDYGYASAHAEEALKVSKQLDDKKLMGNAYVALAAVALCQKENQRAVSLLEESLKLRQLTGDIRGMASLLNNLGNVSRQQEKFDKAATLHRRSLTYFRQLGDHMAVASVLNNLAEVEWCQEHYEQAVQLYEESLKLCRALHYTWGIASSLVGLGDAARRATNYEMARSLYKESLLLFQEMEDQVGIAACLEGWQESIRQQHQLEAQEQPEMYIEVTGYSMSEPILTDEDILATIREELGEEMFKSIKISRQVDSIAQPIEDAFRDMF